jgi:hypothetical protein
MIFSLLSHASFLLSYSKLYTVTEISMCKASWLKDKMSDLLQRWNILTLFTVIKKEYRKKGIKDERLGIISWCSFFYRLCPKRPTLLRLDRANTFSRLLQQPYILPSIFYSNPTYFLPSFTATLHTSYHLLHQPYILPTIFYINPTYFLPSFT